MHTPLFRQPFVPNFQNADKRAGGEEVRARHIKRYKAKEEIKNG
jgi:hypothetical protein